MAFREKDELDWSVFAAYGVVMSYVQEFEFGLNLTIGHYRPDLAKTPEQLWALWKATGGRLLQKLEGHLPSVVFEDLDRLVESRNWLAHDFFRGYYSIERLSHGERVAHDALGRLDLLSQEFQNASHGLLALRTRITRPLDTDDKIQRLWVGHGRRRPTE